VEPWSYRLRKLRLCRCPKRNSHSEWLCQRRCCRPVPDCPPCSAGLTGEHPLFDFQHPSVCPGMEIRGPSLFSLQYCRYFYLFFCCAMDLHSHSCAGQVPVCHPCGNYQWRRDWHYPAFRRLFRRNGHPFGYGADPVCCSYGKHCNRL